MKRFRCKRTPDGGLILSAPAAAYLKREMSGRISHTVGDRFAPNSQLHEGDIVSMTYSLRVDFVRASSGYVYIQFKASEPVEVEAKQRRPAPRARLR